MFRATLIALVCSLLLAALPLAQQGPESAVQGTKQFTQTVLASDLDNPWEVTWGPDGMLWVTERSGKRVTRIDPRTGARQVAITIDEVSAPGGQDGLLGMAFHPELLQKTGNDYVYVSYTYVDRDRGADPRVSNPENPFRYLYGKIVRLRYDADTGTLSDPQDVIVGLPASNDHNAMRLRMGLDRRLYLSMGDGGNGQFGHVCQPIQSQHLPSREDLERGRYTTYRGKTLRIELDGSVPRDNPSLAGVVSHVFTYGHRNPQGLAVGPDGTLYSSEHGPKTDDEVNVLVGGGNYGWPHLAGMRDNKAYEYARWADATTPCSTLKFSDFVIHPSVPREAESSFALPVVAPIATLFTVPTGTNFEDPACKGINFVCWPTVGPSSIEFYDGRRGGIPGWGAALIVPTLKRGSLYVLPLDATLKRVDGPIARYLHTANRYRDLAIHPDGRTLYVATDNGGIVESPAGGATTQVANGGSILAFTYTGEGDASPTTAVSTAPGGVAMSAAPDVSPDPGAGPPPRFTSAQAAAGKAAYDSYCAVCHGSTLTNGTFGTPLAGPYFQTQWRGRTVAAFYAKAHDTMPPAAPASLSRDSYAAILAYIFEVNGIAPGDVELPSNAAALKPMRIP